jgi:hypothetical protein
MLLPSLHWKKYINVAGLNLVVNSVVIGFHMVVIQVQMGNNILKMSYWMEDLVSTS